MIAGSFPKDKCGVGDYTHLLCNTLNEKVDLSVLTTFNDIEVNYPIIQHANWGVSGIRSIMKKINFAEVEIVHLQVPTRMYGKKLLINILPMLLYFNKNKVVTTIHEYSDNSTLGKIRLYPNILFSSKVIVVDSVYKEDMIKLPFIKESKIEYINIAANIPKSNITIDQVTKMKSEIFDEQDQYHVIGYFGFVNESKCIESILEVLTQIKIKTELKIKFLMIAELNSTDAYHKMLLNMIAEYNLEDMVYITGYLEDMEVSKYISLCDVLVFPFKNGFSPKNGSVLAALQEGKKVITTSPVRNQQYEIDNLHYIKNEKDTETLLSLVYDLIKDTSQGINSVSYNWNDVANMNYKIYEEVLR